MQVTAIYGDGGLQKILRSYLGRLKGGSKVKPPTQAVTGGSDRVTLSPEAQQAARIRQALKSAQLPADRQARVDALKQQVQKGQYQVSSRDIAEKIARDGLAERPQ